MRIENQNNISIDELLDHLKGRYPAAEIKKPFLQEYYYPGQQYEAYYPV